MAGLTRQVPAGQMTPLDQLAVLLGQGPGPGVDPNNPANQNALQLFGQQPQQPNAFEQLRAQQNPQPAPDPSFIQRALGSLFGGR